MLVTSPAPRSAWIPRAEPCTIFGSCDDISDAQWVYQKGWIKARIDLQPQGMSHDDLVWVQLNAKNWDAPDCPLDLPDVADYDAAAVPQLRPCDVPAATRQSATCEACLQTRLGRRKTRPHSLVWGECLRAPRPLAEEVTAAEEENANYLQQPRFEDVDPENQPQTLDEEELHGPEPIECYPHAAIAMSASTTATWGSAPSSGESTTDPSDDVREFESSFTDDDDYPIGPITSEGQAEDEDPSPEE